MRYSEVSNTKLPLDKVRKTHQSVQQVLQGQLLEGSSPL